MNNLVVFEERELLGKEFRIYGDKENPLFLAKDVATWIEHSNVSIMLGKVDDEEKKLIELSTLNNAYGRKSNLTSNTWFLTEDGMYEVLMQSRKPIAKAFKKEVKKILKQIRQTGGYIPVKEEESNEEFLARAYLIAQETLKRKEERLKEAERTIEIQKPKVEAYELFLDSEGLCTVSDVAKMLGVPRKEIFEFLREEGMVFLRQTKPTKKAEELGYLKIKMQGCFPTMKVTPKGIEYIKNNCFSSSNLKHGFN